MVKKASRAAALAILAVAAQPALAADDFREVAQQRRTGAFAGASFSIASGRGGVPLPIARLQLGIAQSGTGPHMRVSGLELGASGRGKAALYLNGQEVRKLDERLGFKGSTGTVLLLGAVAGLGALLLVAFTGSPGECDSENELDFFC